MSRKLHRRGRGALSLCAEVRAARVYTPRPGVTMRTRVGVGVVVGAFLVAAAAHARGDDAASAPSEPGPDGSARGDGRALLVPLEKRALAPARRVALAPLDAKALLAEDARSRSVKGRRHAVVREHRPLRAPRRLVPSARGVVSDGRGGLVWTGEIEAKGALSLRLRFSRFVLPPGASVVVHDAEEPAEGYGPFAGAGPSDAGAFWTPAVYGDRVRVELRVPAESVGASLLLEARAVLHAYREAGQTVAAGPKASGSCNVDAACDGSVSSVSRGVALMSYVSSGWGFNCSGALLNDTDGASSIPWFLTAEHCISTEAEANSCEFYWDYAATGCGGSAPSLDSVPRTNGSTLVVASATTDVSLLRLTGALPSGRTMIGWTSATPSAGSAITGVHHPSADVMKVSRGQLSSVQSTTHDVAWSSGVTEPGSSGSPLLGSSLLVIGQLSGGWSSCSNPSGIDSYGRFDSSYPLLQSSLDPAPTPDPGPTPGPDPNPAPGPGPVGDPPGFFLGLWQKWVLGNGEMRAWRMDVLLPSRPGFQFRMKVQVKGRPGAWAKVTSPQGVSSVHPKGKSFITTVRTGYWPVELHAAAEDKPKLLKVKISKNW